jgi:hypothetical protein
MKTQAAHNKTQSAFISGNTCHDGSFGNLEYKIARFPGTHQ